jgi:hypothetical protein
MPDQTPNSDLAPNAWRRLRAEIFSDAEDHGLGTWAPSFTAAPGKTENAARRCTDSRAYAVRRYSPEGSKTAAFRNTGGETCGRVPGHMRRDSEPPSAIPACRVTARTTRQADLSDRTLGGEHGIPTRG